MKRLYPILSALLLLVACAESDTDRAVTQQLQNSPDFHATFEADDTRTFVDEKVRLLWTEGDLISIFTNTLNQKYEFDGETGDNSGTFTPISSGQFGSGSSLSVDANYAVYPYNQSTKISYDGDLSIELPATQAYAEDSFGVNANTMVAVTQSQNDNFLSFKNLGGFLKLQLYGDVTVKSIQLEGNNGEKIAGGATVTAKYGKNPTLTMDSDATTSITLDCGAGVKLGTSSSSATEFWIVVPPVTFSKGFTITITDTEGGTMTKSTTKSYTVERNVIKSMAAFKVETTDPTSPPANEIWYTSIDGKIVEPYSDANHQASSSFDANIVSNVYKDGKGIITFDKDVTTIGRYAFFARYNLESIVLPNGITSIGYNAFAVCISLKSVVISNSVTSIGANAFAQCGSLSDISIPSGVTTIGTAAFLSCTALVYITIPNGVTTIGKSAFAYCSSLTSITIPDSVIDIGDGAFQGCESLTAFYGKYASADNRCLIVNGALIGFTSESVKSYTIPDGVSSIGTSVFSGCSSLTEIIIPNTVASIGPYAFYECSSLTSITIPNSVSEIGYEAFYGCKSLKNIVIPNSVTKIESRAFVGCSSLTSAKISDGLLSIGMSVFDGCRSLTSFYGRYASSDNKCLIVGSTLIGFAPAGLTSYTIPESIGRIGSYVFSRCNLESIDIPGSVIEIMEGAFSRNESLNSITIPDCVKKIGGYAFKGCSSLANVYCKPNNPPTIGDYVFDDCTKNMIINVPVESAGVYKAASGWSKYKNSIAGYDFDNELLDTSISIPANQIWYTSIDGNIVDPILEVQYANGGFDANLVSNEYKDGKGVITFDKEVKRVGDFAFNRKTNLSSIIIPEGCVEIGRTVFQDCSSLRKVYIPESVKKIGGSAFSLCSSLEDISIPEGVKEIMEYTFQNCSNLETVTIPSSVDNIDDTAFKLCSSIKEFNGKFAAADHRALIVNGRMVAFAPAGLTQYSIPSGTTIIGDWVFHHCTTLTNIHIPEGVFEIGEGTFMSCSGLISITIPNSVNKIGEQAFGNCTALSRFNSRLASSDSRSVIINGTLIAFAPAGLTTYTIPNGVTKIDNGVFQFCDKLKEVFISQGVVEIGDYSFCGCSSLENVYMPEGLEKIRYMAFYRCLSLKEVCIPKSVKEIESYAFEGCTKIETISCKSALPPTLGMNTFAGCNKLRTINVPHESVANYKNASGWSEYSDKIVGCEFFGDYAGTEVPNNQIWYTSADESVVQTMKSAFGAAIVSNVYENGRGVITCDRDIQIVGKEAFGRSPLLLGVALPESVTTIDANAFAYTSLKSITIPNGVTSIGLMAFAECRDLRSFYGKYASEDNRALIMDGCLIAFAPAGLTYYSTPPGTTKIGDCAFWGCSNLGGIEMGENVKEIGAEAFYGCSRLESFHLPQFVMKVGTRAFAYCGGLEYITIDEYAIEIGNEAFLKCGNLTTVHCRPANPPSIGRRVFELCDKLRRIEVPHKSIDSYKTASGWSEYADKIDGDV